MTYQEIIAALLDGETITRAEAQDSDIDTGMVSIVFTDGEVSTTKCGPLLGQRNLHMARRASSATAIEKETDEEFLGYPCFFVPSYEVQKRIEDVMLWHVGYENYFA